MKADQRGLLKLFGSALVRLHQRPMKCIEAS
jgi:hypothetical protein